MPNLIRSADSEDLAVVHERHPVTERERLTPIVTSVWSVNASSMPSLRTKDWWVSSTIASGDDSDEQPLATTAVTSSTSAIRV